VCVCVCNVFVGVGELIHLVVMIHMWDRHI
jgi:hypothetical protein